MCHSKRRIAPVLWRKPCVCSGSTTSTSPALRVAHPSSARIHSASSLILKVNHPMRMYVQALGAFLRAFGCCAYCATHLPSLPRPTHAQVAACLSELEGLCDQFVVVDPETVPWFPTRISDIDNFSRKVRLGLAVMGGCCAVSRSVIQNAILGGTPWWHHATDPRCRFRA